MEAVGVDEIWKPVVGYEGRYEVSSFGRVRSLEIIEMSSGAQRSFKRRRPMRVMRLKVCKKKGYVHVGLTICGKQRTYLVHRLIAHAFIGPCPDGMEVSHWDGARANNVADNIVYETHIENEARKAAHGTLLFGERHYRAVLTPEQVREIRLLGPYDDPEVLAEHYGVTPSLVCHILCGRAWARGPSGEPKIAPALPRPPSWAWANAETVRRHH